MQPKAASSIKASVEDQLITSVFCLLFFIFLIKSYLSLFSLRDICPSGLPKRLLSMIRELETSIL